MNSIKPADGIGNNIDESLRYQVRPHNGRNIVSGNASFQSHLDEVLVHEDKDSGLKQVELPRELRTPTKRMVLVSEEGSVLIPSKVCTAYSSANSTKEREPNNVWYT